ncbi:hypothetical protein Droror1_Dr00011056 [Drosera rotundifolia]
MEAKTKGLVVEELSEFGDVLAAFRSAGAHGDNLVTTRVFASWISSGMGSHQTSVSNWFDANIASWSHSALIPLSHLKSGLNDYLENEELIVEATFRTCTSKKETIIIQLKAAKLVVNTVKRHYSKALLHRAQVS